MLAIQVDRGRALAALGGLLCALLAGGCAERRAVDADWPPGALLVARTAVLAELATRARVLESTPLARVAAELQARLPDCDRVEAHAPDGRIDALIDALRCSEPGSALADVRGARGERDVILALPVAGAGRAVALATLSPEALEVDVEWVGGGASGPLALLLPGDTAAGPARLSEALRLVHLRVRPEAGIDVGALVADGSQADQLFRLRAALFSSAVLDGAWEGAIYLPPDGGETPRVAVALDVAQRSAAMAAAEAFVADLARTWQLRPVPFRIGEAPGSCLPDLALLPELAPCYVATEAALVVGWNAASLRHALAATPDEATAGEPGYAELDLALFTEADALLSRHLGAEDRPHPLRWPWRRAVARAARDADGTLRLRLRLEGGLDT